MNISTEFWKYQKGLVLVGSDGEIVFTRAGRTRYASILAKYGFALGNVKSLERFQKVLSDVNAGELEANTIELEKIMDDPLTNEFERDLIRCALTTDEAV
jgi:hypothetical protein